MKISLLSVNILQVALQVVFCQFAAPSQNVQSSHNRRQKRHSIQSVLTD